jgi:hypothetical protein
VCVGGGVKAKELLAIVHFIMHNKFAVVTRTPEYETNKKKTQGKEVVEEKTLFSLLARRNSPLNVFLLHKRQFCTFFFFPR